jgi:hypothetical protein
MPRSGSGFGYEAGINSADGALSLLGSGEYAGDKIDGTFKLRYYNAAVLEIGVADFDTAKAKQGFANGSFTLKPTPALSDFIYLAPNIPGIVSTIIAGYTLDIELESGKDNYRTKITARDGREALFAALDITVRQGDGQNVALPPPANVVLAHDTAGLLQWALGINGEAILADLKQRFELPAEIMEQLESLVAMLSLYKMFY